MNSQLGRRRKYEAGFTLIEVLVSIIILSFGLLGMVGLQAASLQANRDARLQSIAVGLAREFAEMVRGNKTVALTATGNPYLGTFSTPLIPTAPSYCLKIGSTCTTATDVAAAELTEWLARVDAELPGAVVTICNDTKPYDGSGKPQWACAGAATDPIMVKIGWTRSSTRTGNPDLEKALIPSVVLAVTPGNAV